MPCTGFFASHFGARPFGSSLAVFRRFGSIVMHLDDRPVMTALEVFQLVETMVVGYVVVCMAPTDKKVFCGIDIPSLP